MFAKALTDRLKLLTKGRATVMSEDQMAGFLDLLPKSVADLRTEAYLPVIVPQFMKSLPVPGDLCEFG